jgi:hypothetical protein
VAAQHALAPRPELLPRSPWPEGTSNTRVSRSGRLAQARVERIRGHGADGRVVCFDLDDALRVVSRLAMLPPLPHGDSPGRVGTLRRGERTAMDQVDRDAALQRLDVFVGTWALEAIFPSDPARLLPGGRSVFAWMKGGRILVQRTEVATPAVPDSLALVVARPGADAYTQHYFDSRGVARLYAMAFKDGVWTLVREAPDFSPLEFAQRFTGTFTDGNQTIRGVWERSADGVTWEKDFDLTYRKIP